MPLSEEELRLLEQMERALTAEDPKFVSMIRGTRRRRALRRRAVAGVAGSLLGLSAMVAGVTWRITAVGVLGFVLLLTAAVVGVSAVQHRQPVPPSPDFEAAMFRHPSNGGHAGDPARGSRGSRSLRDRFGGWRRRGDGRY